jgi:hypothetical protein
MYEISKYLSKNVLKAVIIEGWEAFERAKHYTPKDQERIFNMGVEIKELLMSYLHENNVDDDILSACKIMLTKENILELKDQPYNLNKLLLLYNAKKNKDEL